MKCPKCNTEVPKQNINIQADIAQCINCDTIFKISETLEYNNNDSFDLNNPPDGAWFRNEVNQVVIGATTRSPVAFFLVPFMLVWSGGSLGGIYGSQILSGKFNPFMSLFGIPFLIGSVIFWSVALMAIWGKIEVTISKEGGRIFTGIGNIGTNKKFIWEDINTIKEQQSNVSYPGSQGQQIILEGKKRISFGSGLKDGRRYYIYRALKSINYKIKSNNNYV